MFQFSIFKQFKIAIILLFIDFVLFPVTTFAAKLYLEPATGQYQRGDTFIVEIRIDTQDQCINTVEANLNFSQDSLEMIDFSQGNSILTLWVKLPVIDQSAGLVSFSGGIPGGYCGRISGDPAESNLLGKMVFKIGEIKQGPASGETLNQAKIEFLDSSRVLLNDGLGTKAELTTKGAIFQLLAGRLGPFKDEWREELEKDSLPPELFEIKIHQDPAIFEGKYFIVFSAVDKQTGIDHYEVKEGRRKWKIAQLPYLLENQKLTDEIKVKAVDKAGNERIAQYIPEVQKSPLSYWIFFIIIGLVIIGLVIAKLRRTLRETTRKL